MLTLLDVVLLLAVALSAWAGWRAGATGFLFGFAGLAGGLLVGL